MRKAILAVILLLALCQVPKVASAEPLPSLGKAQTILWVNQWSAPRDINYKDVQAETEDLVMALGGRKVPQGEGAKKGAKVLFLWISTDRQTMQMFGGGSRRRGFSGLYAELPIEVTIKAKVETLTRDWYPDPRRKYQPPPPTDKDTRSYVGEGVSTLVGFGGTVSIGSYKRDSFEAGGMISESLRKTWKQAYERATKQLMNSPKQTIYKNEPIIINQIRGPNNIQISVGSAQGVNDHDVFLVFTKDAPVKNANSGEILTQYGAHVATIRVHDVEQRYAMCELVEGDLDMIRQGDLCKRSLASSGSAQAPRPRR